MACVRSCMRRRQTIVSNTIICPKCKSHYKNTDLKQAAYMKCLWCGHMLIPYEREKNDSVSKS